MSQRPKVVWTMVSGFKLLQVEAWRTAITSWFSAYHVPETNWDCNLTHWSSKPLGVGVCKKHSASWDNVEEVTLYQLLFKNVWSFVTGFASVHENEQLLQQHKEISFGLCFATRVMQERPGVGCGESKSSKVTDSHRLRLLFKIQNRSNVFCLDWIRGVKAVSKSKCQNKCIC